MKILVAEDDRISRLRLQALLKDCGEVHGAVNGHEAVDAVRLAITAGKPYTLICLDLMMPVIDGLSVLKLIREMERAAAPAGLPPARVVMTTAVADKAAVAAAIGARCDGYLVKPIDKAELQARLLKLGLID